VADQSINGSDKATVGIAFILVGMLAISVNDMLIKQLSGDFPLHQMVFIRSAIGICFSLVLVHFEGGFGILRTKTPLLHVLRGLLIVVSNMTYFTALSVIPLADATALFFVAPLMITLFSIPLLGEKVGPLRLGAVFVGFVGVIIMMRPWQSSSESEVSRLILMLPVLSAITYALMQIMTRRLGVVTKASALSVYIQGIFIFVSLGFYFIAGDGRFAEGMTNQGAVFLLRAWVQPDGTDWYFLIGLGMNSAIIGYALSQAYRSASAATIAPYEYVGLPLAVFWGWLLWGDLPGPTIAVGIVLILGSGLFVFFRERQRDRPIIRRVHRRY